MLETASNASWPMVAHTGSSNNQCRLRRDYSYSVVTVFRMYRSRMAGLAITLHKMVLLRGADGLNSYDGDWDRTDSKWNT